MRCPECAFWSQDPKDRKVLPDEHGLEFRLCVNPLIVPINGSAVGKGARKDARVFCKGTARNQLYTHCRFGCALAQVKG